MRCPARLPVSILYQVLLGGSVRCHELCTFTVLARHTAHEDGSTEGFVIHPSQEHCSITLTNGIAQTSLIQNRGASPLETAEDADQALWGYLPHQRNNLRQHEGKTLG